MDVSKQKQITVAVNKIDFWISFGRKIQFPRESFNASNIFFLPPRSHSLFGFGVKYETKSLVVSQDPMILTFS